MANRVRIMVEPSRIAESLFALDALLPEDGASSGLLSQVTEAANTIRETDARIVEVFESLWEGCEVEVDDAYVDDGIEFATELESAVVSFGIRELASDPDGIEQAELVRDLLELLDGSQGWDVAVYFGGRTSTPEAILAELERRVRGFEAAGADGEARRRHRRHEYDCDSEPDQEPLPVDGDENVGGFGGFDADVAAPRPVELGGAAREVLRLAELSWPCSPAELKRAFRRLALRWHPDRNAGDPEAGRVFARINEGFAELDAVRV